VSNVGTSPLMKRMTVWGAKGGKQHGYRRLRNQDKLSRTGGKNRCSHSCGGGRAGSYVKIEKYGGTPRQGKENTLNPIWRKRTANGRHRTISRHEQSASLARLVGRLDIIGEARRPVQGK